MAVIQSFCAIRPTRDKAHLVATRPYYTYKKHIMDAKLEENPYTFMHIISPEYGLSDKTEPNSLERFSKVKNAFNDFVQKGILVKEIEPALYVYRQTKEDRSYTGVIAGASVEEYLQGKIKKHEATISAREQVFENYLEVTGFNAEPVLLSHAPHGFLNELFTKVCTERSEYEFSTTDCIKHELWIVRGELENQIKHCFAELPELYIADGHHRSASSSLLAQKQKKQGAKSTDPSQFFLAFFLDETQMDIFPFHRVAKELNGHTEDSFLEALSGAFDIQRITASEPAEKHLIHMYLNKQWYELKLKDRKRLNSSPVKSLDAQVLTDFILAPILGIHDLRSDNRIAFVSGEAGMNSLIEKTDSFSNGVGFVLHAIPVEDVKAVADAQCIMPPKSTWVEPKLRSGLTIYPIFNA